MVSLLVDMGLMPKALFVFDSLPYKNEESWNSLISGLVRFGQPHHALKMYHRRKMSYDQFSVNDDIYIFSTF